MTTLDALRSIPAAHRHTAIEQAARRYLWQARAISAAGMLAMIAGWLLARAVLS
jgi:hypothetical protein